MKTIILTDGSTTQVSDEDYEYLNEFSWYSSGHAVCRTLTSGQTSRVHSEVALRMGLRASMIDHKDRDYRNNLRDNLRPADKSTNGANRGATRTNMYSSYKGVSFSHAANKWIAFIRKDKKRYHIGVYSTEDEAALAYNHYALSLFGEFAFLNVVE